MWPPSAKPGGRGSRSRLGGAGPILGVPMASPSICVKIAVTSKMKTFGDFELVHIKLNLEMAATPEMVKIAIATQPHTVMLVPEGREEVTTEGALIWSRVDHDSNHWSTNCMSWTDDQCIHRCALSKLMPPPKWDSPSAKFILDRTRIPFMSTGEMPKRQK